jgi:hypothetical protein
MLTMPKVFGILLISATPFVLAPPLFAGPIAYGCCVVCEDGTAPNLSQGGPYGPDDEELCLNAAFDNCDFSLNFLEFKFGPGPQTCTPVSECVATHPVTTIKTIGKGQSSSNNPKVMSYITGHIVDPGSLGYTAHRIPVCAGTRVDVVVIDSTGAPTVTENSTGISCTRETCVVTTIGAKEKYIARSADGRDTDRITIVPK